MELLSHSSTFLLPSVSTDQSSSWTYALVVLNQKLRRFIPLLWNHTRLRLCAGGGANRLYDEMPLLFPHQNVFLCSKKVAEILDECQDQDTTDLHKCIAHVLHSFANIKKSNMRQKCGSVVESAHQISSKKRK